MFQNVVMLSCDCRKLYQQSKRAINTISDNREQHTINTLQAYPPVSAAALDTNYLSRTLFSRPSLRLVAIKTLLQRSKHAKVSRYTLVERYETFRASNVPLARYASLPNPLK